MDEMMRGIRKKAALFLLIILLLLSFSSCAFAEDEVRKSLGECIRYEFYSEGGFQDYTDYGKYFYQEVDFSGNEYFHIIQPEDLAVINRLLDDFEGWIKMYRQDDPAREIAAHYDFDRSVIECGDYAHIVFEEHTWPSGDTGIAKYDIYIFDVQTNTLYYFHNNI